MDGNNHKLVFHITKQSGQFFLTENNKPVGEFASEHAAADMAVRFAQDNDRLYVIFY